MKSELIKSIIVQPQGEKEQGLFRLCFAVEEETMAFNLLSDCARANLSIQCFLSGIQMCHISQDFHWLIAW